MNANTATSNLADATEALKHNFLTRGFFKKRGYYNLADISPENYRGEKAFTNPTNRRLWFAGSPRLARWTPGVNQRRMQPGLPSVRPSSRVDQGRMP